MPDYSPPRILTRADWLARPPTGPITPRPPSMLTGTVVHHEAADPPLDADFAELVASIQRFHQQTRGWADIAYNLLVWHDGTVAYGRAAGVRGAHTVSPVGGDWNLFTLGVCVVGNGDDPAYVTDAAWDSVLWAWGLGMWGSGGRATGFLTHHETGSPTHCAGDALQDRMDGLRRFLAHATAPAGDDS